MSWLATTASVSPFIGLFGTVWGIINAFQALGLTGSTSMRTVAPGIANALFATALGLFAAIPAAVFYNYFGNSIKVMGTRMEDFSLEFLNAAERMFVQNAKDVVGQNVSLLVPQRLFFQDMNNTGVAPCAQHGRGNIDVPQRLQHGALHLPIGAQHAAGRVPASDQLMHAAIPGRVENPVLAGEPGSGAAQVLHPHRGG